MTNSEIIQLCLAATKGVLFTFNPGRLLSQGDGWIIIGSIMVEYPNHPKVNLNQDPITLEASIMLR